SKSAWSMRGGLTEPGTPAPNVPIADLFAQAQERMGPLSGFAVSNPGRDNAIVRMGGPRARADAITFSSENMTFDGVTGRVISPPGNRPFTVQTITNGFAGVPFGLHGGTGVARTH